VFLVWMFTLLAIPAGLGLLAAVEPALAPLLHRPAEGVLVSFQGGDEPGDGLYPVVRFEVDGAAYTCTSWVCVASGRAAVRPGGRRAEGLVGDWSEARAGSLLGGTGVGLAVVGLTAGFVQLVTGMPALGPRRFARWWAKALAVWLGCVLLGGAAGLVLLGG